MRILWVDDDGPRRFAAELEQIRGLGHVVDFAVTTSTALKRLEQNDYDLLLIDNILDDEFQGVLFVTQLLKDGIWNPNKRILFISGWTRPRDESDIRSIGADLMNKPIQLETLLKYLRDE